MPNFPPKYTRSGVVFCTQSSWQVLEPKWPLRGYEEYENCDVGGASSLKIARLRAHGEKSCPATYEIEDASKATVLSRMSYLSSLTCPDDDKSETASLLLVCTPTSSNGSTSRGLGMSKSGFLDLVDALDLDRSVLQPLVSNVFGFLEFSEGKDTSTYFLADAQMKLMWSFNFATSQTKAILIARRRPPNGQSRCPGVCTEFLASLRQQRENIFNPYTLLFISLVRMAARECSSNEKTRMLQRPPDRSSTTFEQINNAFASGTELGNLDVPARHIEALTASLPGEEQRMDIVDSLLDALSDQSTWRHRFEASLINARRLELCERDINVFAAVIRPLRQQVAASRSAAKYTAARAQSQSQLILAESARRDTASMKTIAVMTMAFLPGTFFAALFSVPELLRWDREVVVGDRFWVYWVFTLPVTAFVFLTWMVLSYDDGFKTALDEYQRRKRASVDKNDLRNA
ncbi:hypothetical protein F5Y08DRAFT_348967 [Xylaria arbuscula]|nr:hypothetical protein F5Y08DRAFT_348967 [Xylaria arbuscula]